MELFRKMNYRIIEQNGTEELDIKPLPLSVPACHPTSTKAWQCGAPRQMQRPPTTQRSTTDRASGPTASPHIFDVILVLRSVPVLPPTVLYRRTLDSDWVEASQDRERNGTAKEPDKPRQEQTVLRQNSAPESGTCLRSAHQRETLSSWLRVTSRHRQPGWGDLEPVFWRCCHVMPQAGIVIVLLLHTNEKAG